MIPDTLLDGTTNRTLSTGVFLVSRPGNTHNDTRRVCVSGVVVVSCWRNDVSAAQPPPTNRNDVLTVNR